ncbi:MAG TPA: alkaline phosphatase family protein [Candidatus Sulfotelmatobacter sp.]|nr:alkaline phosphatase family protein [Candidatus Sulfotelmatobacter sp.]
MVDPVRRRLIQGSAAAALAVLGGMPRPAAAADPASAKLSDIDHIIILMKENRSFDHYFGSLAGVRGFDDATALSLAGGRSVFHQPDEMHRDGYILPFRLDTRRTNAQRLHDLNHDWGPQHAAWNNGAMDNWIAAHRAADGASGPLTMGYHTREDLPFYYALADAFTICDGYHCSQLGPTHPNRYFLMTATIDPEGRYGGPALDNRGQHYRWETYPERLERAKISWRIYHDLDDYYCNVTRFFVQYQNAPHNSALYENALRNRPFFELLGDLRSGSIPQVTWIVPPSFLSEHPDYLPAAGEDHTRQILEALWSNPALWARTLLILNYDENDGQFDHVPPPTPEPGTPGEFVAGLPIGLGFRVPCLLISPFTRGGYVAGETFDHTSALRLIEARFGVEVPNLSAWRRRTCGDFTRALGLGEPARLGLPALPETAQALLRVERDVTTLPPPAVPERQAMPRQEAGTRPRRSPA